MTNMTAIEGPCWPGLLVTPGRALTDNPACLRHCSTRSDQQQMIITMSTTSIGVVDQSQHQAPIRDLSVAGAHG